MFSLLSRPRRAATAFLSLLLTTLVAAAHAAPSFEASILEARPFPGGTSLLVEADLPGYGADTKVSTGVPAVLDEDGYPVAPSELTPGRRVRVEFDGSFMESYPLQVHARRITLLAESNGPTMEGYIQDIHARGDSMMVMLSSTAEGRVDLMVRMGDVPVTDAEGEPVAQGSLAPGMRIAVEFDGRVLESMPPQIVAEAVVILERPKQPELPAEPTMGGHVLEVEARGMIWLSLNQGGRADLIVRVSRRTKIEDAQGRPLGLSDIAVGDRIEATYDGKILESMPPQIEASRVRVQ